MSLSFRNISCAVLRYTPTYVTRLYTMMELGVSSSPTIYQSSSDKARCSNIHFLQSVIPNKNTPSIMICLTIMHQKCTLNRTRISQGQRLPREIAGQYRDQSLRQWRHSAYYQYHDLIMRSKWTVAEWYKRLFG